MFPSPVPFPCPSSQKFQPLHQTTYVILWPPYVIIVYKILNIPVHDDSQQPHCLDISLKEVNPGVYTVLYRNVHRSLVHNSQIETTQMSISW